jgi:primosomal protein N' (replication factor Y)
LDYPPFSRLINFKLVGNSEKRTKAVSEEMGEIGRGLQKRGYGKGIEILGPSAAPFTKIRGKYRWQMLAKGKSPKILHQFAKALALKLDEVTKGKGINLEIDVDPVFIL